MENLKLIFLILNSVPYRANLFNSNILAISAENDLNLFFLNLT